MLPGDERRIFDRLEGELAARRWRARAAAVGRIALVAAALVSVVLAAVLAGDPVTPAAAALWAALAGVVIGWQVLSHLRRHVVGPRLRARWRCRTRLRGPDWRRRPEWRRRMG